MQRGLVIATPPGVAKRPECGLGIAAAEAIDQYQQVYRQRQQAIGHRLQHVQQ
ncbi:hypothetical protein D3C76_1746900 [compost metagenome]